MCYNYLFIYLFTYSVLPVCTMLRVCYLNNAVNRAIKLNNCYKGSHTVISYRIVLFRSYLTDRSHCVRIGSETSSPGKSLNRVAFSQEDCLYWGYILVEV